MKIKVLSKSDSKKTLDLPKEVLKSTNLTVVSEYINYVRSASRMPIADTKDRSEVSGGGKKPWRQKGTGHARHGSSRSPLWVGGGVTFGPTNKRNFWLNYPKKFRQYARLAIFNYLAEKDQLSIIEDDLGAITKTKQAENLLSEYNIEGKITLIVSDSEMSNVLAFRNLPYLHIMTKTNQNMVALSSSDNVIFSQNGYKEYFSNDTDGKTEEGDK